MEEEIKRQIADDAAQLRRELYDDMRRIAIEECRDLVRAFGTVGALDTYHQQALEAILLQRLDAIGSPDRARPNGNGGVEDRSVADPGDLPLTG